MKIPEEILKIIHEQTGLFMNQPSDCEVLSLDIEQKLGVHLGVNTVKRLFGILDDGTLPRKSTLNILAQFLGEQDWSTMLKKHISQNSNFQKIDGELFTQDLENGIQILLGYTPDRELLIQKLEGTKFQVISCKNSQLQVCDLLDIDYLIPEFPLIVKEVIREGKSLGRYTAGFKGGLSFIKVLKD